MYDSIVAWLESIGPVHAALCATIFTWLMTTAGASLVIFFKYMHRRWFDGMLGFTGGVMVAASFWSLLLPSIDMSWKKGACKSFIKEREADSKDPLRKKKEKRNGFMDKFLNNIKTWFEEEQDY